MRLLVICDLREPAAGKRRETGSRKVRPRKLGQRFGVERVFEMLERQRKVEDGGVCSTMMWSSEKHIFGLLTIDSWLCGKRCDQERGHESGKEIPH
jgi:hypothetical protein